MTMTTLATVTLRCPLCDTSFDSRHVTETNSLGGKRTDFHEKATGVQPLPYMVHSCPHCYFTAGARQYDDPIPDKETFASSLGMELQALVVKESGLHPGELKGSLRYELAAEVGIALDYEHQWIAALYLRAAWCCVDEGDVEAERYFRRLAAQWFEVALESYDGVQAAERAVVTYLIGELWRRIGDVKAARVWFKYVPREIVDEKTQAWVVLAAKQQMTKPREWFG